MPGMGPTMHEWKAGKLHSGSEHGPIVESRAQAIAIGMSEQRKMGGGKPGPVQGAIFRARSKSSSGY